MHTNATARYPYTDADAFDRGANRAQHTTQEGKTSHKALIKLVSSMSDDEKIGADLHFSLLGPRWARRWDQAVRAHRRAESDKS